MKLDSLMVALFLAFTATLPWFIPYAAANIEKAKADCFVRGICMDQGPIVLYLPTSLSLALFVVGITVVLLSSPFQTALARVRR